MGAVPRARALGRTAAYMALALAIVRPMPADAHDHDPYVDLGAVAWSDPTDGREAIYVQVVDIVPCAVELGPRDTIIVTPCED